jgi:hypothetical protein
VYKYLCMSENKSVLNWTFCKLLSEKPNGTARLKNVNNCLNTDIYSYLVTPGG